MKALSTAASGVRHVAGAIAEAGLIVAIVGALAFGVGAFGWAPGGASDVFASNRGGNGTSHGHDGAASTASSISLDQADQLLVLGTKVTFTTSVVGLTGNEYALVYLKCTEDGAVVYGQLDLPGTTFVLGGGSSPWWQVGGTATCVAYLEAYGSHGGSDTIRVLAQTAAFTVN